MALKSVSVQNVQVSSDDELAGAGAPTPRKPSAAAGANKRRLSDKSKKGQQQEEEAAVEPSKKKAKSGTSSSTAAAAAGSKSKPTAVAAAKKDKAPAKASSKKEPVVQVEDSSVEMEVDEPAANSSGKDKKAPTAAYVKSLESKLAATTTALNEVKALFETLQNLRQTEPEANEAELKVLAEDRAKNAASTVTVYREESEKLKEQKADLVARLALAKGSSKSRSSDDSEKLRMLEAANKDLKADKALLKDEVVKIQAEMERIKGEQDTVKGLKIDLELQEAKHQKELAAAVASKEAEVAKLLAAERAELAKAGKEDKEQIRQLTTELSAEVEHSKELQAKLKTAAVAAVPSIAPRAPRPSGDNLEDASAAKIKAEMETLKNQMALAEDLSGLAVVSAHMEGDVPVFSCLIQDCHKSGGLEFKIAFVGDDSLTYTPSLDAERDAAILALLPAEMKGPVTVKLADAGAWYARLFTAINRS